MRLCAEILGKEFSAESDDLSTYMVERLLNYGWKQAIADSYASLTEKSGKTDADRLIRAEERFTAIVNDDRTAWREGGGGGKPLDPVTEKVRDIVRDRAKDMKVFSTVQALDKQITANIEVVYTVMGTRVIAGLKECSEAHASKAYGDVIKLWVATQMEADIESATKMVEVARMKRETEKAMAAELVAQLEAKLAEAAD